MKTVPKETPQVFELTEREEQIMDILIKVMSRIDAFAKPPGMNAIEPRVTLFRTFLQEELQKVNHT